MMVSEAQHYSFYYCSFSSHSSIAWTIQDQDKEARQDANKEGTENIISFTNPQNREHNEVASLCSEHKSKHHCGKGRWYTTSDIALPATGEMHGKSIKIKAEPSVLFWGEEMQHFPDRVVREPSCQEQESTYFFFPTDLMQLA